MQRLCVFVPSSADTRSDKLRLCAPARPVRGTGGSIHGAVHPMQAMLNYAIGVLAGRMTRVVIAKGLDAGFGFLHDGRKPGRLSLVWDAVEPHRPGLVRAVFRHAEGRAFKRYDFGIFANDGVGLLSLLAKEIAELTVKMATLRDMVKTVDWVAGLIKP